MWPKTFLAHIKFTISTMMREAERKQGKHYSKHQCNTLSQPLFLVRYKDLIWDITKENFTYFSYGLLVVPQMSQNQFPPV